jgi:hypothetical protein
MSLQEDLTSKMSLRRILSLQNDLTLKTSLQDDLTKTPVQEDLFFVGGADIRNVIASLPNIKDVFSVGPDIKDVFP